MIEPTVWDKVSPSSQRTVLYLLQLLTTGFKGEIVLEVGRSGGIRFIRTSQSYTPKELPLGK